MGGEDKDGSESLVSAGLRARRIGVRQEAYFFGQVWKRIEQESRSAGNFSI
jgi:hypothetical protein